jgi:hypothetical protein
VRVDSQDLAQQAASVLGRVVRVLGAAAVADADVEQPVRAEGELSAVVVRLAWVPDQQHGAQRLSPRSQAPAPGADFGDHVVSVVVRVVEVGEPVAAKVRVEGDREQALLSGVQHPASDVEEGPLQLSLAHHAHPARLLDHVERTDTGRRRHVHGRLEAPDRLLLQRRGGGRGQQRRQCEPDERRQGPADQDGSSL